MAVYFLADDSEAQMLEKEDKNGVVKTIVKGAYVKIGRTTQDLDKRRRQLQTGNPRPLKFMGYIQTDGTEEDQKIESTLHGKFNNKKASGERYKLDSIEVLDVIQEFPYSGFLAVSEDSLKILGYDRDAIPEIGGVWDWKDLDWEECCPYCGSVLGLFYEEKFMAHNCYNCGIHYPGEDFD